MDGLFEKVLSKVSSGVSRSCDVGPPRSPTGLDSGSTTVDTVDDEDVSSVRSEGSDALGLLQERL